MMTTDHEQIEVLDRAEIADGKALVSYGKTEAALVALDAKYRGVQFDLTTTAGDKAARAARQDLVTLRTSLDKKRLEFKRPVLDIGKLIDSEAKRITDKIKALEDPIDAQIVADEQRREAIRAAKAAAEAARVQKHRDAIARIRGFVPAAQAYGMTAERVLKGLSVLEAITAGAELEEFQTEAAQELSAAIEGMKSIHATLTEREAEAARAELQRKEQIARQVELDRIAAEQARAAAEIARQQAEIAAQQAEIARQAAAMEKARIDAERAQAQRVADEQARAAAAAAKDAQDREDARLRALALEAQASQPVVPIKMQAPAADEPATLKLGDIAERLGFALRGDFLADVLGIQHSATDKAAKLYRESDYPRICHALIAHITASM